jgi:hypothetical protein
MSERPEEEPPKAVPPKAAGRDVVFGLGGAWGFASADLTSPERAARAEAFTDSVPPVDQSEFTELRVHGVSGSTGPAMLEHPVALQVAGDSTTRFYRRWTPAGSGHAGVPWKLEAYSWGGLTEKPLASASWLLLAPFMLYNVAHFALPPQPTYDPQYLVGGAGADRPAMLHRDRPHAWAQGVLRVLAFSGTLQFTAAVVTILVSTVALQARSAHFPSWLSWYPQWSARDRVSLALIGVAAVLALIWLISVVTAKRYEARTSEARPGVKSGWPLTQTNFWKGQLLVRRQRSLHSAGAIAATAFIVSRPGHQMGAGRQVVMWAAALVLALVVISLCLPLADRHAVTMAGDEKVRGTGAEGTGAEGTGAERAGKVGGLRRAGGAGNVRRERDDRSLQTWWCWGLLAVAAVLYVGVFFTGGWPAGPTARTLPGFTNICAFLVLAQAVLLVVLALVVTIMVRRARQSRPAQQPAPDESMSSAERSRAAEQAQTAKPFSAGHLTTAAAVLAVCLGGVFTAVMVLFVTRLLGTPVPSGDRFQTLPAGALQIPWPIYAFAAAPLGLVAGVLAAAGYAFVRWLRDTRRFAAWDSGQPGDAGSSEVWAFYHPAGKPEEPRAYHHSLRKVARSWAIGRLVDGAGVVFVLVAGGMLIATVWAEIYAAQATRHPSLDPALHGLAAAESLIGLILAAVLITLLRADYSNPARRKTIGILWDVGTFWPRAAHPFAPPCYAERAIPELVDRIRILTGNVEECPDDPAWRQIEAHQRDAARSPGLSIPAGPVLLTGYSQGAIITPAVVAQLPGATLRDVALLTLACPARRLYGRAFPAYFGAGQLDTLGELLQTTFDAGNGVPPGIPPGTPPGIPPGTPPGIPPGVPSGGRWKNLVRQTDYIGSYVFRRPVPDYADGANALLIQPGVDQPCWDPVSLVADIDPTPPPTQYHTGFWPDPRVTQLGECLGRNSFPPT